MIKKTFLLIVFISLNTLSLYSQQIIYNCIDTINSDAHGHLGYNTNCTNKITISPGVNNIQSGIEIDGIFKARGGVRIIPGNSSVKFVASNHDDANEPSYSHGNRKSNAGTGSNAETGRTSNTNNTQAIKSHNSLVMYPNPARDYVSFTEYEDKIIGYEVFNVVGVLQLKGNIPKNNASDTKINISTLNSGQYIVTLILNDHTEITKLLVKH